MVRSNEGCSNSVSRVAPLGRSLAVLRAVQDDGRGRFTGAYHFYWMILGARRSCVGRVRGPSTSVLMSSCVVVIGLLRVVQVGRRLHTDALRVASSRCRTPRQLAVARHLDVRRTGVGGCVMECGSRAPRHGPWPRQVLTADTVDGLNAATGGAAEVVVVASTWMKRRGRGRGPPHGRWRKA
jgi:hypothetical protein